jgi:hypothetical protein
MSLVTYRELYSRAFSLLFIQAFFPNCDDDLMVLLIILLVVLRKFVIFLDRYGRMKYMFHGKV